MDFGFTETQEMFRRTMRDFAQRELAPGARERASLKYIPKELFKKMGEIGLLGLNVPTEYGGCEADWISAGIAMEELGKADIYVLGPMSFGIATCLTLCAAASEELRQEWIPRLVTGDKCSCVSNTEPDCGSDAAAITTRAIRDGDQYVITGEKTSITFGSQADVTMLFAKTDPAAGARGVSCFLVPLDLPGITRYALPHSGYKPSAASSITFDHVSIPAENRIGEEGKGFHIVMGNFDLFRVLVSLTTLALAQATIEETIAYVKQRHTFGRPIAAYQGVSFKIAEAVTLIDAARLLAYRALWLKDRGLPHGTEASMTKWFATEVTTQIIHDAMILHGHAGFSEELPFARRLQDAIGHEIIEGPAQIQKLIIARAVLGREFG